MPGECSWVVFSFKDKQSHQFNGRYEYTLAKQGDGWLIRRKKNHRQQ